MAGLFFHSYEADFVAHLKKSKFKKQTKNILYLTFRFLYGVLSLNNHKFKDYIDAIYPEKLEIKSTTDSPKWANYLDHDLRLECDDFFSIIQSIQSFYNG